MNVLKPTYVYASVANIPVDRLCDVQSGLKGLSWDLDGTMVEHLGEELPKEHLEVIEWADQLGLAQAIISNAQSEERDARLRQVAKHIYKQTIVELPTVSSRQVGARKPRPDIFRMAADRMGLKPSEIIHTGDQIVRDIIGANMAGFLGSILVAPYGGTADEGWPVRKIQRPLESVARVAMGYPFRDSDFSRNPPLRTIEYDSPN